MFQISARMQESDLAPTAELKGFANRKPQMMPPGTVYASGTLVFVKFSGLPDGTGSYNGHLYFDVVDEPLPHDKLGDIGKLLDFANSTQATEVTDPPALLGTEQEPEPEQEPEDKNQADDESADEGDNE